MGKNRICLLTSNDGATALSASSIVTGLALLNFNSFSLSWVASSFLQIQASLISSELLILFLSLASPVALTVSTPHLSFHKFPLFQCFLKIFSFSCKHCMTSFLICALLMALVTLNLLFCVTVSKLTFVKLISSSKIGDEANLSS